MPIDPLIARGGQVSSPARTLAEIAALRQRDMALAQNAQSQQMAAQKFQRDVANEEQIDRLWDEGLADIDSKDPARFESGLLKLEKVQPGASDAVLTARGLKGRSGDNGIYGNINPGDFTPESMAAHAATVTPQNPRGDFSKLVLKPFAPPSPLLVNTPGGGAFLTSRGGPTGAPGSVIEQFTTPQQEADARAAAAGAEASAKTTATTAAEAAANLPKAEYSADQIITTIENFAKHPGTPTIYGGWSLVPIVPGTERAGAASYLDQIGGQAFLQAFESLKGGGQITEIEGTKATQALTRLNNRKISYEEAQQAMKEFVTQARKGLALARQKAGAGLPARPGQTAPGAAAPAAAGAEEWVRGPDGKLRRAGP